MIVSDGEVREVAGRFLHSSWRYRSKVILILSFAVTIVVATLWISALVIRGVVAERPVEKPKPAPVHHEEVAVQPPEVVDHPYEIENFALTLGNKRRDRSAYVQFNLVLDCPNAECQHWMSLNRASIRDSVYQAAAGLTVEELDAKGGLAMLKGVILKELQTRFKEKAPNTVWIRDWFYR